MKAYIVSTAGKQKFVNSMILNFKREGLNIDLLHNTFETDADFIGSTKKHIEKADIVLIVVDENFLKSEITKKEMEMVLDFSECSNRPILFPIILDESPIPRKLSNIPCFRCDSKSDENIQLLAMQIRKLIAVEKSMNLSKKKSNSLTLKKNTSLMLMMTGTVTGIFAAIIPFVLERTTSSTLIGEEFTIVITSVLVSVVMAMMTTTYAITMRQRNSIQEKEDAEQYSKKLKETITNDDSDMKADKIYEDTQCNRKGIKLNERGDLLKGSEINALGRMLINLEDIKEFYTWSQKQAKDSFILAVVMCIGGFSMIVIAILLSIVFGLGIETAIIPAIGGAISEAVAGTSLFVYKSSLLQLNHYHKALHEDERFLSSVNLLSQFSSSEMQDEMLKEIIQSEIQMNLSNVHVNETDDIK